MRFDSLLSSDTEWHIHSKMRLLFVFQILVVLSLTTTAQARIGENHHERSGVTRHRKLLEFALDERRDEIPDAYLIRYAEGINIAVKADTCCSGGKLQVLHVYPHVNALSVANVSLSMNLDVLLDDPDVLFAERDHLIYIPGVQSDYETIGYQGQSQGHQVTGPTQRQLAQQLTGKDVWAFVVDSGILSSHQEFQDSDFSVTNKTKSRVRCGIDFLASEEVADCKDEWGHGTYVAGLVGGTTHGLAKAVELVAVKVFDGRGRSRFADVIAAVDYVIEQKKLHPDQPMVVNLSLGASHVALLMNEAVNRAVKVGIPVVVAAGNGGFDSCTFSPASAEMAITVAASTQKDTRLSSSNWGKCVNIYALGEQVQSAWIKSDAATRKLTGTSVSSPIVAGAVALYLESNPNLTPAEIWNRLQADATPGILNEIDPIEGTSFVDTPNLLLNVDDLP